MPYGFSERMAEAAEEQFSQEEVETCGNCFYGVQGEKSLVCAPCCMVVGAGHRCHFLPSKWKERTERADAIQAAKDEMQFHLRRIGELRAELERLGDMQDEGTWREHGRP